MDDDLAALVAGAEQMLADVAPVAPELVRVDDLLKRADGLDLDQPTRELLTQIDESLARLAGLIEGESE